MKYIVDLLKVGLGICELKYVSMILWPDKITKTIGGTLWSWAILGQISSTKLSQSSFGEVLLIFLGSSNNWFENSKWEQMRTYFL